LIRVGEWQMMRAMQHEGMSITEIARRTGRDRKTVRKALAATGWPADEVKPRVKRGSKLDLFRDYIRARLERAPITAVRMLRAVTQAALTAATHHPESRLYYQKKLAGRSDPRTKTLALIALARHCARRLYKLLRRASLPSAEVAA